MAYFGAGLPDLLLVHDDLYVELGRLKIVAGGGSGGHKGVGSLIDCLKDEAFARIKVGLGRPDPQMTKEGFVLSRFRADEEAIAERMVEQAADAAETVLGQGLARAQTRFNRKGSEI
jgi:PTH1 family peptidyl-tRNA hydrolase